MNLSIIIPIYNGSNYILKLLKSIEKSSETAKIMQKKIEVIIVDDKSDDYFQLQKIISSFNLNIKLLKNNQEIKGAGICRNIGLEKAEGDMILFADADDYFIDNWFEKIYPYLNSKNDVVFFSPISKNNNLELDLRSEKFQRMVTDYLDSPTLKNELSLKTKFHMVWSKLYSKKFLSEKNIKFDETIVANDVMFSLKTSLLCSKFDVTIEPIYCWIFNEESLTTKVSKSNFLIRCNVMKERAEFIRENVKSQNWKFCDLTYGNLILEAMFRYKYNIFFCMKVFNMFILDKNMRFFDIYYFSIRKIIQFVKKNTYY